LLSSIICNSTLSQLSIIDLEEGTSFPIALDFRLKLFLKQHNQFLFWGHYSKKKKPAIPILPLKKKKKEKSPILLRLLLLSPPSVPIFLTTPKAKQQRQQQGSGSTASEKLAARVNSSNSPS
jgi:hypothetical protein